MIITIKEEILREDATKKSRGISLIKFLHTPFSTASIYYISQFAGASLSDKYGRKNLLVYPLAIYAAAIFIAGFSTHSWIFFKTFILRNIGAAPYGIVALCLIGDIVAQEHRGTAIGAILFVPGIIGGALNLLLRPTIEALTSLQVSFFVCSAVVVGTIVMLLVALPQDKKTEVTA